MQAFGLFCRINLHFYLLNSEKSSTFAAQKGRTMLYNLIISLPMALCLFWLTFFLIRCFGAESEPRVTRLLACFFAAAGVLYTNHWLFFSGHPSTAGEWLYVVANLCVYPIYYAYLRALTRAKRSWEVPLLLAPALVSAVLFPIVRFGGGMSESVLFVFTRVCFAMQVVWVLVRGSRLLLQTIRRMDDTYSDDRSRLLRPTYQLLIFFGITSFVSIVLNVIGRDYFAHETVVIIPAVLMVVLLYGLGYVAAHTIIPQETVGVEVTGEGLSVTGEEKEFATTEETDELMFKIANALRDQKLYADPRLTIQDLATAVHSNRTYISNCINRRTGLSFSQYIARYRVENAQTILRDSQYKNDHDAIAAAIALSGFSSDKNFYRVFKDITGTTPLAWRKMQICTI